MKRSSLIVAILTLLLNGVGQAKGGPLGVAYFEDYALGTDAMSPAIDQWAMANPGANVFKTNDDSAFASQLATGNYSIAVFFAQNYSASSYSTGTSALSTFFAGGGKVIVDDWNTDDNSFLSTYGATFAGPVNNPAFTVNPNSQGLPTGDYSLFNPGWVVYTTDLTDPPFAPAIFDLAPNNPAIVYGGSGSIVNGFLSDTFSTTTQGTALYLAELNSLSGSQAAVPEPASLTLLGLGIAGLGGYSWRRRKQQVANA